MWSLIYFEYFPFDLLSDRNDIITITQQIAAAATATTMATTTAESGISINEPT